MQKTFHINDALSMVEIEEWIETILDNSNTIEITHLALTSYYKHDKLYFSAIVIVNWGLPENKWRDLTTYDVYRAKTYDTLTITPTPEINDN